MSPTKIRPVALTVEPTLVANHDLARQRASVDLLCRNAAASIIDDRRHFGRQLRDDVRLLKIQVVRFTSIIGKVVELTCRITRAWLDTLRSGETTRTKLRDQRPIATSHGHHGPKTSGTHYNLVTKRFRLLLFSEQIRWWLNGAITTNE